MELHLFLDIRQQNAGRCQVAAQLLFSSEGCVVAWYRYILFFWFLLMLSVPAEGFAEGKVPPHPLVLGQSCALSGPAKDLGVELRGGLLAAFSKINDEGGVNRREIVLLSRDDGYEPDRAVRNTRELITRDQVFMLIGEVGTPTSKAVAEISEQDPPHTATLRTFSGRGPASSNQGGERTV